MAHTKKGPLGSGAAPRQACEMSAVTPLNCLLTALPDARRQGKGYRANCPNGHSKAKGSLSFVECADGAVLMHCFACGDTLGVLRTLGLTLADLYPRHLQTCHSRRSLRERRLHYRAVAWSSALTVAAYEASVVLSAAAAIAEGIRLSHEELLRVSVAAERLEDARGVMRG